MVTTWKEIICAINLKYTKENVPTVPQSWWRCYSKLPFVIYFHWNDSGAIKNLGQKWNIHAHLMLYFKNRIITNIVNAIMKATEQAYDTQNMFLILFRFLPSTNNLCFLLLPPSTQSLTLETLLWLWFLLLLWHVTHLQVPEFLLTKFPMPWPHPAPTPTVIPTLTALAPTLILSSLHYCNSFLWTLTPLPNLDFTYF